MISKKESGRLSLVAPELVRCHAITHAPRHLLRDIAIGASAPDAESRFLARSPGVNHVSNSFSPETEGAPRYRHNNGLPIIEEMIIKLTTHICQALSGVVKLIKTPHNNRIALVAQWIEYMASNHGIEVRFLTRAHMRPTHCILLVLFLAVLIAPAASFARTFTPQEQALIEYIAKRIQEIAAQVQLLIQQRQVRTTQPPGAADIRAPKILNHTIAITDRSFTLSWKTDEPTKSRVIYGYNEWLILTATTSTFTISDNELRLDHMLTIPGLTASTTYYYDIEATDAAGNVNRLGQRATSTLPRALRRIPEITRVKARAATTSATVTWRTDVDTKGTIYFGATYPLKPTPQTARMNNEEFFGTIHSLPLTELTASTTYYFVIEVVDRNGNSAITGDYSFATKRL